MRYALILLLIVACLAWGGTRAQADTDARPFSVWGELSFNGYAMEQVNRSIGLLNSANSGLSLPNIGQGYGIGGGAQYALTEHWLLGFEINTLSASTQGSYAYQDPTLGKTIAEFDYDLPALEIGPMIKYAEPIGANVLITTGIALDVLYLIGDLKTTVSNYQNGSEVEDHKRFGPGYGFKYLVGCEVRVHPALSVGLEGGVRLAKVPKVTDEHNAEVPDFEVDYSGLFLQGNVKLHY